MQLPIAEHPTLYLRAFTSTYASPLGEIEPDDELPSLLTLDAETPVERDDGVKSAIRDLLRHGGFKPTGRSKPASEYLLRAANDGMLRSINLAVNIGNAVSLHSGIPISVVDLDQLQPPLEVAIAAHGSSYVFNPAGQELDIGGLLGLRDHQGFCANAVKDSQRTKTSASTRRTLTLIWGCHELRQQTGAAETWYHELLASRRVDVTACDLRGSQIMGDE